MNQKHPSCLCHLPPINFPFSLSVPFPDFILPPVLPSLSSHVNYLPSVQLGQKLHFTSDGSLEEEGKEGKKNKELT